MGSLDIVALDSSVPGKPHGEIDDKTLAWLDAVLASNSARPTLVFLHHPPFRTGIGHMDRQNLFNANALEALVRDRRHVQLIGCGHVHRHAVTQFANVPMIICPGASHAVTLDLDGSLAPSFRMETPGLLLHVWDDAARRCVTHAIGVDAPAEAHPFFSGAAKRS